MSPSISVCIPTLNGAAFIAETIESVLRQDVDFELILCDGGSSDNTVSIIRSFENPRIRFVDNSGSSSAEDNWNTAIASAQAPLVKVMGQDDVLFAGCLRSEIEMFSQSQWSSVTFCFSRRRLIINGRIWGKHQSFSLSSCIRREPEFLLNQIVRSGRNPIGEPVAVTMRRSAIEAAGGFRGSYVIDLDLYSRMLEFGGAVSSPATLSAFRVSASSWSHQLRKSQRNEVMQLHGRIRKRHRTYINWQSIVIGSILARVYPWLRTLLIFCHSVLESVESPSRVKKISRYG